MPTSSRGFAHLILIFIVVVLIGAVAALLLAQNHRSSSLNTNQLQYQTQTSSPSTATHLEYWQNPTVTSKLPTCQGNDYLTSQIGTMVNIERLIPLGNIGPPGHTYPTDHIYVVLKKENLPGNVPTLITAVFAPGNVHVIGATSTEYYTDGQLTNTDWEYAYTPCQQLTFYNAHIRTLMGGLKTVVDQATKTCDGDQHEGIQEYKTCNYHFDYNAKAGEQIGVAGGITTNAGFDWGAFDTRLPKLAYLNQQIGGSGTGMTYHMACPIDYYAQPIKDQLYALFPSRPEPRCGTPMQDLANTAQGNWRLNTSNPQEVDWAQQLALVHDNTHPNQAVVSVGGTILPNGAALYFDPQHTGLTNREPSEVKSDGHIYCYHATLPSPNGASATGHILIQLTTSTSLKAEYHTGPCTSSPTFTQPAIYSR